MLHVCPVPWLNYSLPSFAHSDSKLLVLRKYCFPRTKYLVALSLIELIWPYLLQPILAEISTELAFRIGPFKFHMPHYLYLCRVMFLRLSFCMTFVQYLLVFTTFLGPIKFFTASFECLFRDHSPGR